jgi:hypothetical protein
MPNFHVVLRSTARGKAECDLPAKFQEEADQKALLDAKAGNALWRYDGLVEDAPIEVDA